MNLSKFLNAKLMQSMFSSWRYTTENWEYGYTALLPVPADLPVFLQIALNNIAAQNHEYLIETLVLPDKPSDEFRRAYEMIVKRIDLPRTRLVEMNKKDKIIGSLTKNPNTYHFLQLVNGIEQSKSTHVLFHDADLFISNKDFLRDHFKECTSGGFNVLGPNPRRDRYIGDCRHLVATWEMLATMEWLKRFKPYQLRGQEQRVNGKTHGFDTTLWLQYLTKADEIGCTNPEYHNYGFIHFNFVITTYRIFCKSSKPFEDKNFKILLIRLLINSLDNIRWRYCNVPSIEELVKGLAGQSRLVSYNNGTTASNYSSFRQKLHDLLMANILSSDVVKSIKKDVIPFDKNFNWHA